MMFIRSLSSVMVSVSGFCCDHSLKSTLHLAGVGIASGGAAIAPEVIVKKKTRNDNVFMCSPLSKSLGVPRARADPKNFMPYWLVTMISLEHYKIHSFV